MESTCVLLYAPPLSPIARERLGVLRDTSDGFEVARRDLELRGPGELLGTRLPRHLAGSSLPGRGWGCGTRPEGLFQLADPAVADQGVPLLPIFR